MELFKIILIQVYVNGMFEAWYYSRTLRRGRGDIFDFAFLPLKTLGGSFLIWLFSAMILARIQTGRPPSAWYWALCIGIGFNALRICWRAEKRRRLGMQAPEDGPVALRVVAFVIGVAAIYGIVAAGYKDYKSQLVIKEMCDTPMGTPLEDVIAKSTQLGFTLGADAYLGSPDAVIRELSQEDRLKSHGDLWLHFSLPSMILFTGYSCVIDFKDRKAVSQSAGRYGM